MKTMRLSPGMLTAALVALFLASPHSRAAAQGPDVSNVLAQPVRGTFDVQVTYDLACDTADSLFVQAWCSLDGGATWPIACTTATGQIGADVEIGAGRSFLWDAAADAPGILTDTARIRVMAYDLPPSPYIAHIWRSGLDKSAPRAFTKSDTLSFTQNDTIAYGEAFRVGWEGIAPSIAGMTPEMVAASDSVFPYDDGLLGYQYVLPGETVWRPRLFDAASGDSIPYFGEGNVLTFHNDGSGSDPLHALLPSGPNLLQLNTVDILGTEIAEWRRDFWFVVNYDPETIVLNGETDWAHPEDPQVYPYYILMNDPLQTKHPFAHGDRIPDRSYVVFKALMRDDPRDQVVDPGFEGGLTGYARGVMDFYRSGLYSFQTRAAEPDLEPAWSAGADGWAADTLGFLVSPNTHFTMNLRAIDEHGRRDGTPAQLEFDVGFPPCIQCIEALPVGAVSGFDESLACYDPQAGPHPCFGDTSTYYIRPTSGAVEPERTYLDRSTEIAFQAIDKQTHFISFVYDTTGMTASHYLIQAYIYDLALLYHGQDDVRERYAGPGRERWRTLGWKSRIDYDCDPDNEIQDGGGIDDLDSVTWGESADGRLTIDADGLWRNRVRIYVPRQLLELGLDTYRMWLYMGQLWDGVGTPDFDDPRIDELVALTTRQLGLGRVRAVALDQTACMAQPIRPALYHTFRDLRPTAATPPGETWRDCYGMPDVDFSIPLEYVASPSLDDEPVVNYFRIVLQGLDGTDYECSGDGF